MLVFDTDARLYTPKIDAFLLVNSTKIEICCFAIAGVLTSK